MWSCVVALLLSSGLQQQPSRAPVKTWPEAIALILRNGDQAAVARVAEANALVIPKEEINGATKDAPCQSFQSVRFHTVLLGEPEPKQVMEARSDTCGYLYLLVFERSEKATWKRIATLPIRFHGDVGVTYKALLGTPENQVLVHGYTSGWGTGIWEFDFVVLRYSKGRFQVVLDVPEEVNLFEPDATEPHQDTEEGQLSEFTLEDDSNTESGGSRGAANRKLIVEKQTITKHDMKITRWRAYSWEPALGCFVGFPWSR